MSGVEVTQDGSLKYVAAAAVGLFDIRNHH